MAEIGLTPTSYHKFIVALRAALVGAPTFTATFENNAFHFTQVDGPVRNLYLTSVSREGRPKTLSEAEQRYGTVDVGQLTVEGMRTALRSNFVQNFGANKANFDKVLLYTVEAARSQVVYQKVQAMLEKGTDGKLEGSDAKRFAQMYEKAQKAAGITNAGQFRPLTNADYVSHYKTLGDNEDRKFLLGQVVKPGS